MGALHLRLANAMPMALSRSSSHSLALSCLVVAVFTTFGSPVLGLSVETLRAPVTEDSVTVNLKPEQRNMEKLRVLSREGAALKPVPDAVKVAPGTGTVPKLEIPVDTPVIVQPEEARTPTRAKPLSSAPVESAAVLVESASVPDSLTVREIRQWKLVLHAQEVPLPWSSENRSYATELVVGLSIVAGSAGANPSDPVVVQLVGKGIRVEPARVTLNVPGVAGFQYARILLRDHQNAGEIRPVDVWTFPLPSCAAVDRTCALVNAADRP
jgi:hypothetical protein